MTAVRIDNGMINSVGQHTIGTINVIRKVLESAGVTDVELHRIELDRIVEVQDQIAAGQKELGRLLARGPMPACVCTIDTRARLVLDAEPDCPYAHKRGDYFGERGILR